MLNFLFPDTASIWVAIGTFAVGGVFVAHLLKLNRARTADLMPHVVVQVTPIPGHAGWHRVTIKVMNTIPWGITVDTIEAVGGKALLSTLGPFQSVNSLNQHVIDGAKLNPIKMSERYIHVGMHVNPQGIADYPASASFLLFEAKSPGVFTITPLRLTLSVDDARSSKLEIKTKVTLENIKHAPIAM